MSKSSKAILLSALVFPGTGHLSLKQHTRGTFLITITFISLWIIISNALDQAAKILNQIQAEGATIDINRISEVSAQAAQNNDNMTSSIAIAVLLACWIFAIIDCYRLGKIADNSIEK